MQALSTKLRARFSSRLNTAPTGSAWGQIPGLIPQRPALPGFVGQTGGAFNRRRPFIPVASLPCVLADLPGQLADVKPLIFQSTFSSRGQITTREFSGVQILQAENSSV